MDYEQKYKEALERARKLQENSILKRWLWKVFPELAESEDEKIRKELIKFVKVNIPDEERYIAQLEKQGEKQQNTSIWKHWKNGIAGNGDGKPIYLIKYGLTYSISSCLGCECDYIELSELDKLLSEKKQSKKSISFTFDDILALQCCMETVKKVQEDKDLYNELLLLHNKVYDAYTITKR